MQKISIFIGGPITHAVKDNVFDSGLRGVIERLNELLVNKAHTVHSAYIYENFGADAPGEKTKVFKNDVEWINRSDAAIILLPDDSDGKPFRTDGTYIEIGISYAKKKPILLLATKDCEGQFSCMLEGMIADENKVFFATLDNFFASPETYIKKLTENS